MRSRIRDAGILDCLIPQPDYPEAIQHSGQGCAGASRHAFMFPMFRQTENSPLGRLSWQMFGQCLAVPIVMQGSRLGRSSTRVVIRSAALHAISKSSC